MEAILKIIAGENLLLATGHVHPAASGGAHWAMTPA